LQRGRREPGGWSAYGRLSIPVERVEELLAGWDLLFGKPQARP
jgi:hypothetical protein